jgi:TM2 domain-containing membrane protein YozV
VIVREKVFNLLRKKAKRNGLNKKTRLVAAKLVMAGMLCLVLSLACAASMMYGAPGTGILQAMGLTAAMAWITLFSLAFASDVAGTVITRYETCQRLYPTGQKNMKGLSVIRLSVARAASYRAGHGRARRSPSRRASLSASKDSSDDGGSDGSGCDSPAPLSLLVVPFFTSLSSFCKPNTFLDPWRFLLGLGCWRVFFSFPLAGRGRGQ